MMRYVVPSLTILALATQGVVLAWAVVLEQNRGAAGERASQAPWLLHVALAILAVVLLLWMGYGVLLVIGLKRRSVKTPVESDVTPAAVVTDQQPSIECSQPGDPLDNRPWVSLVEECAGLYEDLERLATTFNGHDGAIELIEYMENRLLEILQRCGVTIIDGDKHFSRIRHRVTELQTKVAEGQPIVETIRPGLAVGRRVFCRAVVRLANDSYSDVNQGDAP
ncbi:MAG: hypothetical protein KatS3mg110_4441 [Pirellulaceae bacterium]|nr:MAG: hypothetical protein KatS3mg110_4441 [Pirellulaceae bacterium]